MKRTFQRDSLSRIVGVTLLTVAVGSLGSARIANAEILWRGDYSTGDFSQWHTRSDPDLVTFHLIPEYGRPVQYGKQGTLSHVGSGELLSLVAKTSRVVDGVSYAAGPTRGSEYSAKFVVKSASFGSEPRDCDVTGCKARRTELTMHKALQDVYGALPHRAERWLSISHYVPADWDRSGDGWGTILYQVKARTESGSSPVFSIALTSGGWKIFHRWSNEAAPKSSEQPWQHQMYYTGSDDDGKPYPRQDAWADGLRAYPDVATSQASLRSVNFGGWTDWVARVRFDERGSSAGGSGFIELWKREGANRWVQVLNIRPGKTTRGDMTFDHGIGFAAEEGYGIVSGMYMHKDQVWPLPRNRVIYNANVKVADQNSSFEDLAHDGSSPDGATGGRKRPEPPAIIVSN